MEQTPLQESSKFLHKYKYEYFQCFILARRRVAYIDGVVGWSVFKYFENYRNKCCEGFYATGGGFGRAFCLYDEKVKEEEEER